MNLSELKSLIDAFDDTAFGEPLSAPEPELMPGITPPEGVHPRVLFTQKRREKIKENLKAEEHRYAYELYMKLSEQECDGVVRDLDSLDAINHFRTVDSDILCHIYAKALRYALEGDEYYGYSAVYALKNYLGSFSFECYTKENMAYRAHITIQAIMRIAAAVYDWCYDILSPGDKKYIVAACTNKARVYSEFPDFPFERSGGVAGHQSGGGVLIGWLSFSIAVYDEYPLYYDHVSDLLFNIVVPGQNYYLQSGSHSQGVAYAASRQKSLLMGEAYFFSMSDDGTHLISEKMEDAVLHYLHCIRPDGECLRIGDDFNEGCRYSYVTLCAFYASSLYKNPVLKGFAKKDLNEFSTFYMMDVTPIDLLILNDPELPCKNMSELPLFDYSGSPHGCMIARSSWENRNAFMTYMKIGEAFSTNHEHKDAGSFQIFHRGPLATDSGFYGYYFVDHDMAYNKQTISKNSLLIFNPNKKSVGRWVYSGGQSIGGDVDRTPDTIENWRAKRSFEQAKILYHAAKTEETKDGEQLCYSLLAGDITNAYDADTASEVKRYMFSFNTQRKDEPMAFIVFDRITSRDPLYKKTFLLHCQSEPQIFERPEGECAVISNCDSRLIIQSPLDNVNYSLVGSKGNEFNVNGVNYPADAEDNLVDGHPFTYSYNAEAGWGRIEISPKVPSLTDMMLTVMYLSPDTNAVPRFGFDSSCLCPYRKAHVINTDEAVGAVIFDTATVFPKNGSGFTASFEFELPDAASKCFALGLKGGTWLANKTQTVIVDAESGIAEFDTSGKKEVTLEYLG